MKLSEEKFAKIVAALNEKGTSPHCPECLGKNTMHLQDLEFYMPSYFKDEEGINMNHDYQYIPYVIGSCGKCGYVKQFNLVNLLGKDAAMNS